MLQLSQTRGSLLLEAITFVDPSIVDQAHGAAERENVDDRLLYLQPSKVMGSVAQLCNSFRRKGHQRHPGLALQHLQHEVRVNERQLPTNKREKKERCTNS